MIERETLLSDLPERGYPDDPGVVRWPGRCWRWLRFWLPPSFWQRGGSPDPGRRWFNHHAQITAERLPKIRVVPTASSAHAAAPPLGSSDRSSSGRSDARRSGSIMIPPRQPLDAGRAGKS